MKKCINKFNTFFILKKRYIILDIPFKIQKKDLQRPTLAYTTIGAEVLNFCVRDGNRCIHFAIVTNQIREIIL